MRNRKSADPLRADDRTFFLRFYEENKNFIYFVAKKYTSSTSECDDLVQEAVVRLINNVTSLRQISGQKLAKYIVLTVKTAYLDVQKRQKNEKLIFLNNESLEALMVENMNRQELEQQISARDSVTMLKGELSPKEWAVIEGKYILGLSQDELAQMIGVSPDSVRMTLHRAREKAKIILGNTTAKELINNG